jgi:hypothetical protein
MNTQEFITLNYHEAFTRRAVPVLEKGSSVVVCGMEGSGITYLCRYIAQTWKREGDRKVLSFTAFGESDQIKLAQYLSSLVLGDEMPADWHLHSLSSLLNQMAKKIRENKVGLIFIDRADAAPKGFIDSILTVSSICRDADWNLGVLLGMRRSNIRLELFEDEDVSSTAVALRCQIQPLDAGTILAVLRAMSSQFEEMGSMVENNDATAVNGLAMLTKISGGNFRRLGQFASYMDETMQKLSVVPALVDKAWKDAFAIESLKVAA